MLVEGGLVHGNVEDVFGGTLTLARSSEGYVQVVLIHRTCFMAP